jgi:multiple sugar transport system substrate-binding protein
MPDLWTRQISRRDLLAGAATVGLGAVAAACAPGATSSPPQNSGGGVTNELKILQWSHFVPAYDTWIDGFVKDWGQKNGIDATIDHISTDDLPARMASEVAAKGGHDLVEMNGQILTYLYEKQLVDMGDIVDYAVKKYGPVEPIGKKLAYINGRWVGWPNFYIAIMPQIRTDLFQKYGFDPGNVKTWDDFLAVGTAAKKDGHAAGLAISHCNDANHNWRAVMWAFGASEVKADGKTVNVDTKEMRNFLSFAQKFYSQANTPDVFAWDNASDNRWLDSGVGVYIHDAISSMRSVQKTNPTLYSNLALPGPVASSKFPKGMSMPDANVYVIWKFSKNAGTAKKFLRYYIDHWMEAFQNSQVYNQPMHANLYNKPIFTDPSVGGPTADAKFAALQKYRGSVINTFGYPGPPNYAANQVLANYVIPDMVATAVKTPGSQGVQQAIDFAKSKLHLYYTGS